MPAKRLFRISEGNTYSHVYNQAVENGEIFKDEEDFKVFLGFLKEYLSPANYDPAKKAFTVNGHTYQGVPHQPKNHFKAVELLAYRLLPHQFDLLLHQITPNGIVMLMRSLSTRYSIYFNKKYHRTGTLFAGPYKSVQVGKDVDMLNLTRDFHSSSIHSSFPEYAGDRSSSWINTHDISDLFETLKTNSFAGVSNYVDFVGNYQQPNPFTEQSMPKDIKETQQETPEPKQRKRKSTGVFGYTVATFIFLLLVGLSLTNIQASARRESESTKVLAVSTEEVDAPSPIPLPSPEPVALVKVIAQSGPDDLSVRVFPSVDAKKITTAKYGDVYVLLSEWSEWDKIMLTDGTTGYIYNKVLQKITE